MSCFCMVELKYPCLFCEYSIPFCPFSCHAIIIYYLPITAFVRFLGCMKISIEVSNDINVEYSRLLLKLFTVAGSFQDSIKVVGKPRLRHRVTATANIAALACYCSRGLLLRSAFALIDYCFGRLLL